MRRKCLQCFAPLLLAVCVTAVSVSAFGAPAEDPRASSAGHSRAQMDADLLEVSLPGLQRLYAHHAYTATEVTRWYIDRIARYDGTYRALLFVDEAGALRRAAEEDASDAREKHGLLWGVPIVVKANTSVKGWITNAGWVGYLKAGNELVAPQDAIVVRRLREAGAILLGQTNMPDFAASDTNMSSAGGRTGDAYDVRFSPGGSSGGTAVAVAANFAVFGTGTDTANSIRQPAANNSLVGMLPTRGLTSIAGIHPLDWLRDNTGPLARDVTSAAIALSVMQSEDPLDAWTMGSHKKAQSSSYTKYLRANALKGKRFAVPWFVLHGSPNVYRSDLSAPPHDGAVSAETRVMFMHAIKQMRAAGATVLIRKDILPESFFRLVRTVNTRPYRKEGVEKFLGTFGPSHYHSTEEYETATGDVYPSFMIGGPRAGRETDTIAQRTLETDSERDANFYAPQRRAIEEYEEVRKLWRLDGFVYPALQVPTYDETVSGASKAGPYSETGWVNRLGVPAVSVPGGFYENGLPFGLELSGARWKDGDLLGYAYAFEQATRHRKMPRLVEGLRQAR